MIYKYQRIAMINRNPNIIPIINNQYLEPGRYAIMKEEFEDIYHILERGTLKDDTYMIYCKEVKIYNKDVYLYTNNPNEKSIKRKFSINTLYNTERKMQCHICQYQQQ